MTSATVRSGTARDDPLRRTSIAGDASDLIDALAAIPAKHPARAAARGPGGRGVAAAGPSPRPALRRPRRTD